MTPTTSQKQGLVPRIPREDDAPPPNSRPDKEAILDDNYALMAATDFYNGMCATEGRRRIESARHLETEMSHFERAMVLQVAAFYLLRPHLPFAEPKLCAANALAFSIFDHLRQGWTSLTENYCLVAMTIARNVLEAVVFLTAIGVGTAADFSERPNAGIDGWLAGWSRDKFKAGSIQGLISLIDQELRKGSSPGGQSEWARSTLGLWRIVRSWAHADWVPIATSGEVHHIDEDARTLAVSFGGQLPSQETSKLVGYLYSHFAVDALFALGLAFTVQLADHAEWRRRTEDLVEQHHRWSRTIDSAWAASQKT